MRLLSPLLLALGTGSAHGRAAGSRLERPAVRPTSIDQFIVKYRDGSAPRANAARPATARSTPRRWARRATAHWDSGTCAAWPSAPTWCAPGRKLDRVEAEGADAAARRRSQRRVRRSRPPAAGRADAQRSPVSAAVGLPGFRCRHPRQRGLGHRYRHRRGRGGARHRHHQPQRPQRQRDRRLRLRQRRDRRARRQRARFQPGRPGRLVQRRASAARSAVRTPAGTAPTLPARWPR